MLLRTRAHIMLSEGRWRAYPMPFGVGRTPRFGETYQWVAARNRREGR